MKVVDISDLRSHTGEEVTVRGWLRRKRSSGKIQFLFLRDGSGFVQAIAERSSVSDGVFQNANNLKMESSVVVKGVVKAEERAPGGVELLVTDIEVVQIPEKDFPINKPDHSIDFLMDNRHLWLRTQRQTHILKIRHEIIKAVREFYNDRDFVLVRGNDIAGGCEGRALLASDLSNCHGVSPPR